VQAEGVAEDGCAWNDKKRIVVAKVNAGWPSPRIARAGFIGLPQMVRRQLITMPLVMGISLHKSDYRRNSTLE
jgi:hypothetical protein